MRSNRALLSIDGLTGARQNKRFDERPKQNNGSYGNLALLVLVAVIHKLEFVILYLFDVL